MQKRRFFFGFIFKLFIVSLIHLTFPKISFSKKSLVKTKVLFNPIFLKHHISLDHPESPKRISYFLKELKKSNISDLLEEVVLDHPKTIKKWILTIHTKSHMISLKKNYPLAEKVSTSAIQTCMIGLDKIMKNEIKNAFCAVRPPGHHALNTGKDEGFCYYNHVAVLAKYAQEKYKLKKILIIDWDYHHGNSTEFFFYDDPSVLFFSTHDASAYPGTGNESRKGKGKGLGYNINVDLPCGTNDSEIINSFKKKLVPAAEMFKPNLVIISAGFDSRLDDLLGCYKITDNGFQILTQISMEIANKFSDGKIISVLEGGYNIKGNALATLAHIKTLNNF